MHDKLAESRLDFSPVPATGCPTRQYPKGDSGSKRLSPRSVALIATLALAGCGPEGDDSGANIASNSASPNGDPVASQIPNKPPTIGGSPPESVQVDALYSFTPVAVDPDDDTLVFSVTGLPDWASFDAASGTISGPPKVDDIGEVYNVRISVHDGRTSAALSEFTITVLPNLPLIGVPLPQSYEWDQLEVGKEAYIDRSYDLISVPGDFRGLNFLRTSNDDKFVSAPNAIEFALNRSAEILVAFDARVNVLPSWLSSWEDTGESIVVSNSRSHRLLRKQFEPGVVSLGGNEVGMRMYFVIVDDETGIGNSPPAISGTPGSAIAAGVGYEFQPSASDADGDALSFDATSIPEWASFDSSTGELSGTPDSGDVGTYDGIVITVSDGSESTSLDAFSISVNPADTNSPPSISGSPASSVTQDTQYVFTPSATDPDGDLLNFTIVGRPAWTTFNGATGRLSGTPDSGDIGQYNGITITVSDGESSTSLSSFSISVQSSAPANRAPAISGSPGTTVTQDNAYSFTPGANDPDGDPISFSISGRPSWANFNSGTGRLSGTPELEDVGTWGPILISVTDGEFSDSLQSFSIIVTAADTPNESPTISGSPATSVLQDSQYVFAPSANDPDGDSLTFSISGRPSWASFNSQTGRLSGTPDAGDIGTYGNIVISVSDGEFSDSLSAFSITVQAIELGSASLSWTPPTTKSDGSPLTNLAGYKIYWGTTPGVYTSSITVASPGISSYIVENLSPNTYYFVSTAYDSAGGESDYSNMATKTVSSP